MNYIASRLGGEIGGVFQKDFKTKRPDDLSKAASFMVSLINGELCLIYDAYEEYEDERGFADIYIIKRGGGYRVSESFYEGYGESRVYNTDFNGAVEALISAVSQGEGEYALGYEGVEL